MVDIDSIDEKHKLGMQAKEKELEYTVKYNATAN